MIFWLSQKIDDSENQSYIPKIEKATKMKLIPYKELDLLLEKIEAFEFTKYIVIVSGRMFPEYIDKIKNSKNLYSIPLTIIFTYKKEKLKANIEKEYSKYLENKYYNILGIADSIKELIEKISTYPKVLNDKMSQINFGETKKPKEYDNCLTFQFIKNGKELIFPFLYIKIMSGMKINYNSVKQFNSFLFRNFGKNKLIKDLMEIFFLAEDIPDDIVAKYWARIYTLPTPFYSNINWSLMQLKNIEYNTFIQMLYSGLKDLSYEKEDLLYRGINISNKEIQKIENFFKQYKSEELNNIDNFESGILVYSRAFLSFSLKMDIAKRFMKNNIDGTSKVLFILDNKSKNKFQSNANLSRISKYKKEIEILFFPYSSFIIKDISFKNDYYEININYIGIYEESINKYMEEIKDKTESIEELSGNNLYINDVFASQIIINNNKVNNINEIQLNFDDKNPENNDDKKFNNNEEIISNTFIQINEENIKDEEEVKEIEKKEEGDKNNSGVNDEDGSKISGKNDLIKLDYVNCSEISIKNDFIKLCICKNNKPYIPNLKKVFNLEIYEYNGLDDIMQRINNIKGKECVIILSERLLHAYFAKKENFEDSEKIPLLIIYSLNPEKIKEKFSNYINNKKYNIIGIAESYKIIKQLIIKAIASLKKEQKKK